MELLHFVLERHFDFLAYGLLVASLLLNAAEVRHLAKAQRVGNHLNLTRDHRQIWSQLFASPELSRVLDPSPNLDANPISVQEHFFVTFAILHLHAVFKARQEKMFGSLQAMNRDVKSFFSLPIPRQVWIDSREFQEPEFAEFVEGILGVDLDKAGR